jgi:hypothetical protein
MLLRNFVQFDLIQRNVALSLCVLLLTHNAEYCTPYLVG